MTPEEAVGDSLHNLRVVIVDDHTLFADAMSATLVGWGAETVGIAGNAEEALGLTRRQQPGLVLVDPDLPEGDGVGLGEKLIAGNPGSKVVAVTALKDVETVAAAVRAGFHGYIIKDTSLSQFLTSLSAIMGGQVVMPQSLASIAMGMRTREEREAELLIQQLTARELEVLSLLVKGQRGAEIARRLSVSVNTVRTHIHNVLSKLKVHSQLEAVALAGRLGLVDLPAFLGHRNKLRDGGRGP